MKKLFLFLILLSSLPLSHSLFAQKGAENLQSGPMVGYTIMREAMLWVQTKSEAEVYATYQTEGETTPHKTETIKTQKATAFTAHLVCDEVNPGNTYTYKIFINGKEAVRPYAQHFKTPPLWQYRTDPPAMKIALGSCNFVNETEVDRPGTPYGANHEIFEALAKEEADMMLWLGDNTYLREVDFDSKTGFIKRYTHTRALPELQAFLASTSNIATWDDHDFGPNNSDRSYAHRSLALEVFKMFWANPSYGIYNEPSVITAYSWGDCDFLMLDNRSFRTPNNRDVGGNATFLGEQQREWLIDALTSSTAKFKFVCIGGQVINNTERFEHHANLAPEEREYILDAIAMEGIKNVIFLTGDVHHAELSMMRRKGVTIYDFTVSPLTAGPHDAEDEMNTYRVKGSQVGERNYGIIEVTGPRKERKLTLHIYDSKGEEKFKYEIEEE
jgi:alkaline phosphatase D